MEITKNANQESRESDKESKDEDYKREIKNLTFLCVKKSTAKSLVK